MCRLCFSLIEGYSASKLKVGFGAEHDLANSRLLRDVLGSEAMLMVDANQAWDFDDARRPLTLAGCANLAGFAQYRDFIASAGMAIIQPDLGKW